MTQTDNEAFGSFVFCEYLGSTSSALDPNITIEAACAESDMLPLFIQNPLKHVIWIHSINTYKETKKLAYNIILHQVYLEGK